MKKIFCLTLAVCVGLPLGAAAWVLEGESEAREITPAQTRALSRAAGSAAYPLEPPPGPALREPDMAWVEAQLAGMTLEEKIGQMIVSSSHSTGESLITNYFLGGFVFLGNGQLASNIVASVNRLQAYSPRPLWFAIDAEAGMGARVADATIFPLAMAFGAADTPALMDALGRVTARECRAVGIQVAYGPVVDVNTEPVNPIISTRSFSDNPARVTRLVRSFVTGARSEGLLTTFKHYPGHGATQGDSHSSLPAVHTPLDELWAVHMRPYAELAASGDVDLVMTAHVWYSQVDPTPWPATLSSYFLTDALRTQMGYTGIVISDAYTMSGLAIAVPDEEERTVIGVEAGLDVILAPPSVATSFSGIRNAVLSGRLSEARITESARRVLIAKSRSGLPEAALVDTEAWRDSLRHPAHLAAVRAACEKAFTRAKYTLPFDPPVTTTSRALVLPLAANQQIFYRMSSDFFTIPFAAAVPQTTITPVSRTIGATARNQIVASAPNYDVILVLGYDWYSISSTNQVALIQALAATDTPVIYVGFGAPYHYLQIPDVDAFYCGYSTVDAMQEVAVEALLGQREAVGHLPVRVEGLVAPVPMRGWILQ